jgi:hypothetical protein
MQPTGDAAADGWLGRWLGDSDSRPSTTADRLAPDVILQLQPNGAQLDLRRHTEGIVRGSAKLVIQPSGAADVFDLSHDPFERTPNPASLKPITTELHTALTASEVNMARRGPLASERVPLDDSTKEKLRVLGYDNFW